MVANPESVVGLFHQAYPFSHLTRTTTSTTSLFMGKLRNRQAELQKKLALAKKQNASKGQLQQQAESGVAALSDEEIKELNDRKRFEELLQGSQAFLGGGSDDDYLSADQQDESIDAYRTCIKRWYARVCVHRSLSMYRCLGLI
jgi:hypothetical protein